ncbi:MAG: Na+:solute symporter [Wenzhouxiangellaceae bacterium]
MLDLIIISAFILYAIGSGLRARRQASRSLNEYFLAGQSIKGWQAGVSMAATQFSADTPLMVMGLLASGGLFLFWQLWVYGIAFLLMGFLFARQWRRSGVLTDAELAELRYSGRGLLFLRSAKAIYYGTVINCVVMAFVLVAAVRIAEIFLPWDQWLPGAVYQWFTALARGTSLDQVLLTDKSLLDPQSLNHNPQQALQLAANNLISILSLLLFTAFYATTGGLRSVIATDVLQFILAMVGTVAYAWFVVAEVGGLDQIWPRLAALYGDEQAMRMLSFTPDLPHLLLPFLVIMSLQWLFQMNADGTGYLAQRSMACRSERDATVAAIVFSWLQVVLRSLLWIVIAVGLLVVFPFTEQDMAMASFKADREILFASGIGELLPVGISGLMLTGLLAALASTIDTHLNWGASYWSNDIYKRLICEAWLRREARSRELVIVARLSNLLILGIALAIMTQLDSIQQGWKISLLFGAGMGSVLVLRWLWERINLYSELAAMLASLIAGPLLLYWLPPVSGEIVDANEAWRLGLMALISTAAAVGVTWLTPATDDQTLRAFYQRVRPLGWWRRSARLAAESRTGTGLRRPLLATAACALSMFTALYGLTRWLLPHPLTPWWVALLSLVVSLLLVPLWWRGIDGDAVSGGNGMAD